MKIIRSFFCLLIWLIIQSHCHLLAQCPIADFSIPSNLCKNETVPIVNTSSLSSSYQWDFCAGDLTLTPAGTNTMLLTGLSLPSGITFAYESRWYGFVTGKGSGGKLIRLDFGNSLSNTPTLTDLGNLTGNLSGPESIKLVEEGGIWYGFILNGISKKLLRISFGNGLSNAPTATTILAPTVGGSDSNLRIVKDGNSNVIILSNYGTNTLTLVDLGNSVTNNPTPANVITTPALPGSTGLRDILLIKECNKWYGISLAYTTRSLYRMEFGTNLFSAPTNITALSISPLSSGNSPVDGSILTEGGKTYVLVMTWEGNLIKIDFGSTITNNIQALTNHGKLSVLTNQWSFEFKNDKSEWLGYSINYYTGQLTRIKFPNPCGANFQTSTHASIDSLKYTQPGSYLISLNVSNSNGKKSISKSVTVSNTEAPSIGLTSSNECFKSVINFQANSFGQTITNWTWNINDTVALNGQNVSYQFTAPGTYKVKLQGTAIGGCSNIVYKNMTIYDESVPDFSFPAGVLCSSAPIKFTNLSTKETGPSVKWRWDFGDGKTSSENAPTHIFEDGGTYNVTLSAGVEGCTNTFSKQLTVIQGPKTNFQYSDVCLGQITKYKDLTPQVNIISREWSFGNGETSTVNDPEIVFTSPGTYNVSLKVLNSNGCEVIKTIPVKINDTIHVDFTHAFACSNDSIQFNDLSTLSDGNIVDWKWQVSDQLTVISNQSGKDSKLFFPHPGDYKVKLTTTSEAGCATSLTKSISVLKSPEIDMEIGNLCLGDSIVFKAISKNASQNIAAWSWEFSDGGFDTLQSTKHRFTAPGNYTVYLTGASANGCPKTISREITVYEKPVANFASSDNCLNAPVQFADSSKVKGDAIIAWSWNFDGLGTSNLQHPQFTFVQAKDYKVSLTVTTVHNCSHTITKTVKIYGLPVADFSFTPEVGPPPFIVNFNNTSTDGASYFWDFGTGETSTQESPSYTYNELGIYTAKLITISSKGCSDTISKTIRVMPPTLTVFLEKILVSTITDQLTFGVDIVNTGSRIVRDIEFNIDFGGLLSFRETWTGTLNPEEKMSYPIKTQLVKEQLNRVNYLCVSAKEINNETINESESRVCVNLAERFIAFDPNPNPAKGQVRLSYIFPEEKAFEINFYSAAGNRINVTPSNSKVGLNERMVDTTGLLPGMYFVEYIYGKERTTKKLVIW